MKNAFKLFCTAAAITALTLASVSCDKDNGGNEPEQDSEWTSLGTGEFQDGFFGAFFDLSKVSYSVQIEESTETSGLYRLVNPYQNYPYSNFAALSVFSYDSSEDYYLEINATDSDCVYIEKQNTGVSYASYGYIYAWSYAAQWIENGNSIAETKESGYAGTLKDGVITFPALALCSFCEGLDDTEPYATNFNGEFAVALPGYSIPDYSVSVSAESKDNEDGTATVTANVTLGANADYAVVGIVETSDYSTATNAVESGKVETQKLTASGSAEFTCTETGTYTVVAISYHNDEACDYASTVLVVAVETPDAFTLDDLLGDYNVYHWYIDWDEDATDVWYIRESDTPDKGNFMITELDGNWCSEGFIYGDFDTKTGEFKIYNYQKFYNDGWDDYYFGCYEGKDYSSSATFDTDPEKYVTFQLKSAGLFTSEESYAWWYGYDSYGQWYAMSNYTNISGTRTATVDEAETGD